LSNDDALYRFRVRVFYLAQQMNSVRAACRAMGIHPSTYYRWRKLVAKGGLEMLRPRERRIPQMPNHTPVFVEQRVIAYSLGHPGEGPKRISAELGREKWGGIEISANGVYQVLKRHGLQTAAKRLALIAGTSTPPEPEEREQPQPERHLEVSRPGELVQIDCFYIGRLSGIKGAAWQLTAIDVASSYTWAEIYVTPKNPSARYTSALARHVAEELAQRGWRLEKVMTDNASEFRSSEFTTTVRRLNAHHVFIRPGRPQTNGCVERVQRTILEECWRPAFARYLIPKLTGLRLDLERYLHYYNTDRAHTGRLTKGRTPEEVIGKVKMWTTD
jgi:transposase InsO family protein